jgi:Dolichyl-phosphate-mannose-protein mannosyltransferase
MLPYNARRMDLGSRLKVGEMGLDRAGRVHWLTPGQCRLILVLFLLVSAVGNVVYLNWHCPIDLSGDEAQYWDWSRHLDLSYYSKGPAVAYLIRASCKMFGETMAAVRYPAILLGVGTSIFSYLLTLKLFKSDRLALGAVLLSALVPIFIFGQVFMTIDAPLFFCWAGATYFFAVAVFEEKGWAWGLVGIFAGLGFLSKFAMFLWIPSVGGFLLFELLNRDSTELVEVKRQWKGFVVATGIALLFTIPVIVWNQRHGWVTLKHVAHQTGTSGGSLSQGNFLELIGSQIAALDPIVAGIIVVGIVYVIRGRGLGGKNKDSGTEVPPPVENLREARLLVWVGVPFFLLTVGSSLLAKAQANWPAPAYFTLVILAAYFLSTRMKSVQVWNRWKGWVGTAIIVGIVATPIARDPSLLFPPIRMVNRLLSKKHPINPGPIISKIVGWQLLGKNVDSQLSSMRAGTFVLCDDYMQTAECAFYVTGQPKTYCAGSYYLSDPKRLTQYDIWKDRSLEPRVDGQKNPLLGYDAVYVGKGGEIPSDIPAAFERIERLDEIPVVVRGFEVKSFKLWRCYGFKGMERPAEQKNF